MGEDAFFSGRMLVPPGINAFYKSFTNKKTGKSAFAGTAEARKFKREAAKQLKQTARVDRQVVEHIQAEYDKDRHVPLVATIHFYFEYMWVRDIDGGIKAAIDAAFRHLKLNDNLIIDLHIKKRMDKLDPRVEISLSLAQE